MSPADQFRGCHVHLDQGGRLVDLGGYRIGVSEEGIAIAPGWLSGGGPPFWVPWSKVRHWEPGRYNWSNDEPDREGCWVEVAEPALRLWFQDPAGDRIHGYARMRQRRRS